MLYKPGEYLAAAPIGSVWVGRQNRMFVSCVFKRKKLGFSRLKLHQPATLLVTNRINLISEKKGFFLTFIFLFSSHQWRYCSIWAPSVSTTACSLSSNPLMTFFRVSGPMVLIFSSTALFRSSIVRGFSR